MDWSDLPFFLGVARNGQIGRAAQGLGTDATTVSRRIRRLEKALGGRLFEQGPDGQSLTPKGHLLLERVEAMAGIAADIVDEPRNVSNTQGAVRVSVSEGFGTWFISQHLAALAELYPRLEVDLVANSGFLNPTRRETDVAVLLARPRKGPLTTRKLTDYNLKLYASSHYLASMPRIHSADDLRQHRFVGYIPDIIYAPELRYLDEIPTQPSPRLRSSSINAQYHMTVSGAGIGVLPCFIGSSNPGLSTVLPDIHITRSFWLVTHRETRMFPPIRAFTEWLITLIDQHRALFLGDVP